MEKMLNIVLFGPPGAGKGTQSENLINKYGLVHLSTGDILRSEINRGTELGRRAKEVMDRGELVSDDIVIGMIESKLDDNTNAKGFIFDGFPRTAAQALALDDLLQKKGTGISGMLALEVDDEELTKRLLLRGQDSGRADDRDETVIRRRIQEYNNKTLPLKTYYSDQGKFHSINGIGTIDEIFKALVDRIVFLNAEMDLTSLETDLEHLDLTIQDFEVADDIAPELLLEIDAIKRAEAEEEEEEKEEKKPAVKTPAKRSKVKSKKLEVKSSAKKTTKKAEKKSEVKNQKSKVKKAAPKNAKKLKVKSKKVAAKAKKVAKKVAKKATKKAAPKKAVKKSAPKKSKVRSQKLKVKKVAKKAAPKKSKNLKVKSKKLAVKAKKPAAKTSKKKATKKRK